FPGALPLPPAGGVVEPCGDSHAGNSGQSNVRGIELPAYGSNEKWRPVHQRIANECPIECGIGSASASNRELISRLDALVISKNRQSDSFGSFHFADLEIG